MIWIRYGLEATGGVPCVKLMRKASNEQDPKSVDEVEKRRKNRAMKPPSSVMTHKALNHRLEDRSKCHANVAEELPTREQNSLPAVPCYVKTEVPKAGHTWDLEIRRQARRRQQNEQNQDPAAQQRVPDFRPPRIPKARTKPRGDLQESARRTQPAGSIGGPRNRNARGAKTCSSVARSRPCNSLRAPSLRCDEPNRPLPTRARGPERASRSQRNANGMTHPWHLNPGRKRKHPARSSARA